VKWFVHGNEWCWENLGYGLTSSHHFSYRAKVHFGPQEPYLGFRVSLTYKNVSLALLYHYYTNCTENSVPAHREIYQHTNTQTTNNTAWRACMVDVSSQMHIETDHLGKTLATCSHLATFSSLDAVNKKIMLCKRAERDKLLTIFMLMP